MKFIDISSNNNVTSFTKVKASGIDGVYIKVTDGCTYTSPSFKSQYANAKAAGLKIGLYHFMSQTSDPLLQAKAFLNAISGYVSDCKYMIDIEDGNTAWNSVKANSALRVFTNYLISQNKPVLVYTGESFYNNILNSTVKDLPCFIAKYSVTPPNINGYLGWQYTSIGRIDGVNGNVDIDTFAYSVLLAAPVAKPIITVPVVKPTSMVIYADVIDQVFADKLADYLKCPTINGERPFDYSIYKNVYLVGATPKLGLTSYLTVKLQGANRQDTEKLVNDFIIKGGI